MKITKKARTYRQNCFREFMEPGVDEGYLVVVEPVHMICIWPLHGNGTRFAWIFFGAWRRLPRRVRRKILELWYWCDDIGCAETFSPHIVLDDGRYIGNFVENPELADLAVVEENGHRLRFNAQMTDQLPENVVADVVAYMLAMVFQFAIGTRPDRQGTVLSNANMAQEVDDLMSDWGFDPESVDDWYEETRAGRQPDTRGAAGS